MAGIYWFWSDFVSVRQTKPKKEAPKRIIYPLSVTSEQVLDASIRANIQHVATKVTDIKRFISYGVSFAIAESNQKSSLTIREIQL